MRDTKHLEKHSNKLAENKKEKSLFRTLRKEVQAGAHGTLDYTIKKGVKNNFSSCNTFQTQQDVECVQNYVFLQILMQYKHQFDHQ